MKKLFFIIVIFYCNDSQSQQIVQYSNYLENAFYLNPSVSYLGKNSLNLIYRNQWRGFEGAPKTTFLSYQSSLAHSKDVKSSSFSNFGGFIQNENIGAFRSFKFNFSYSYSFLLSSNWRLSFGSFLGFQQLGLDVTSMNLFDSNDPIIGVSNYSFLFPDFSMGLTLSNNNNFFGISAKQVFQNKWIDITTSDMSTNSASFVLMVAKKLEISKITILPNFMLDFTGFFRPKIIAGLHVDYNKLLKLGVALRNENTVLAQFGIKLSKNLQFCYAHDFSFSNILLESLNSNEFMIRYLSIINEKNNFKKSTSFF